MKRLIPVLLLKNGLIVRSQLFSIHQSIGNPMHTVRRLSNWNVDELILLDISTEDRHDLRRDDLQVQYQGTTLLGLLPEIAKLCFMPLAVGGGIRDIEAMRERFAAGADKCVINSEAVRNPALLTEASRAFGAQAVVVSIDVLRHRDGRLEVMIDGGRTPTGLDPLAWARECEQRGAGEIVLNSVDRDGAGTGYDLALVQAVTTSVSIPVIACGGVGTYADFVPALNEAGASAAAAANIFNFYELAYPHAKKTCIDAGVAMRPVQLANKWFTREPQYDFQIEKAKLEMRMSHARQGLFAAAQDPRERKMRWCTQCLYPSLSATPMEYDAKGLCTGCQMAQMKTDFGASEWQRRGTILRGIFEQARSSDGTRHDCVIGVSGGKDSYFQTHYVKNVLGYKPLLVTYYGNNYTPEGEYNLRRMAEVFDVDHIIYKPSVTLLKKLNRLGFQIMGDMNWHGHMGIATLPMKIAALHKIPLVVWGEHGYADLCGQFSMNDFVEWSYRNRLEHFGRGYEWNYMVGFEDITAADMVPYQYPSDQELFDLNLKGIYLSNYVPWDGNANSKLASELYGFEAGNTPFERTYRRASNLDDMHENGAHDYMKYVKFGYGRCTDHASKDIRSGVLSRAEGIALARHHDPVKPFDVQRWLNYVGMDETTFDAIADTFRDPRVWWFDGGWRRHELSD
ncbi:imidazoleglycerol phosphate synthase cyclase subunit [Acidovorax delafieldii]|uniref:imidazole glycerol-phosphate synthase n=1 Tax=Acidovorax delafieldii TaxID=47920 RepID=A0A561XN83_ACIDE|nr:MULTISPECIES: N-acetyl sugar amidotransferase [Acidovorax]KRA06923.1 histidine biosynthesis family protein [Acidovorax sp. Root568]TWG37567.1 imidazoleglycerol phosphate synthase cyclase subunit [Acidovorax delafieldii]